MLTSVTSRAGLALRPSRVPRKAVLVKSSNDYSSENWNEPGQMSSPPAGLGESVGKWVMTPFDLLAFGPRTTAGVLMTFPDRLSTLQTDVEKLLELANDPRPLEEKGEALAKEVEERLVDCLEAGADVEVDVLSNVKMMLPAEAANMLSSMIPEPPAKRSPMGDMSANSWSTEMTTTQAEDAPAVTYYGSDVMADQLVSEVMEIKTANSELNSILDQVRSNTDVAMTNVLLLSLRDARDQLQRRLDEVSPASLADPSVASAVREANILLDEINASFF